MNRFVIEVSGLHKSFGSQKALDGLNLRLLCSSPPSPPFLPSFSLFPSPPLLSGED